MTLYQNTEEFEKARDEKARIAKERELGIKVSRMLQSQIRSAIAVETVRHTGELLKTNVQPYIEEIDAYKGLSKLYINGPHYGYKLNYGFIGVKNTGFQMRLTETNHITNSIEKSSIIDYLATELSELRAEQIVARIKF